MYISLGNLLISQSTSKERFQKIRNVSAMSPNKNVLKNISRATGELKEGKERET